MRRSLILACFLGLTGCYGASQSSCAAGSGPTPLPPTPTPTATPSPSPSPSPSATPDPCSHPVTSVNASGPAVAKVGDIIAFDITPVSQVGPLEGIYDRCNANRAPRAENVSATLRQVGNAGAWKQQFEAVAVGSFSVQFRVDGAVSPAQTGTVTR